MGIDLRGKSYRNDGVQRVQLEPSTKTSRVYIEGVRWDAALRAAAEDPPVVTSKDLTFGTFGDDPIDFQGIEGLWATDHLVTDFLDLKACFPSIGTEAQWTALGLGPWPFAPHDTPADVGYGDVTLFSFGRSIYIPAGGEVPPIVAEGTFTIAAPVFLRFSFTANGLDGVDTAPNVLCLVRLWEGL